MVSYFCSGMQSKARHYLVIESTVICLFGPDETQLAILRQIGPPTCDEASTKWTPLNEMARIMQVEGLQLAGSAYFFFSFWMERLVDSVPLRLRTRVDPKYCKQINKIIIK